MGSCIGTWTADVTSGLIYNLMVVDKERRTDQLLSALADSTRRDILRGAMHDRPSVSLLARRYPMSFAAVQKHVAVLERAGLVTKIRHGREQLVATNIEAVRECAAALDVLDALWRGRMERIDALLTDLPIDEAPDQPEGDHQ